MANDADATLIEDLVRQIGRGPEAAIPLLQAIQARRGYLPPDLLALLCERTEITPAQLAGVATFYTQFRHRPVGRHLPGHPRGQGLWCRHLLQPLRP